MRGAAESGGAVILALSVQYILINETVAELACSGCAALAAMCVQSAQVRARKLADRRADRQRRQHDVVENRPRDRRRQARRKTTPATARPEQIERGDDTARPMPNAEY